MKDELTQSQLKLELHYDSETGVFTRNIARCNSVKIGDVAGCNHNRGYIAVRLLGFTYLAHRLAWMYIHGKFPEYYIDHVSGNRSDNRIVNLREANYTQNCHNRKVQYNNTTSFAGVTYDIRKQKYLARCTVNNFRYHLGYFDTVEEAYLVRDKFARENFKEFYRENLDNDL